MYSKLPSLKVYSYNSCFSPCVEPFVVIMEYFLMPDYTLIFKSPLSSINTVTPAVSCLPIAWCILFSSFIFSMYLYI